MTHIFIETDKVGSNEFCFIKTPVEKVCGKVLGTDYDIVTTGGYTKLESNNGHINKFRDHESPEEQDIVIFDADYTTTTDPNGGGYEKRRQYLLNIAKDNGVDFRLFLFPNDRDDGMFETLLQHIVNPEYAEMLDYFKIYEKQVAEFNDRIVRAKSLRESVFETPDEKARIYSYISAFRRSRKANEAFKRGEWDFGNMEYWNLENDYILPLRKFLKKSLT